MKRQHASLSLEGNEAGLTRRRWLAGAAAGIAGAWLAAGARAQNSDAPAAPRIISAAGAITEMVYALGAQRLLVGTDTTSMYPQEALSTPKIGYMRALSAEGILSLHPTALLTTNEAGPPHVLRQISEAGVRVIQVPASHDWDEVLTKVKAVGEAVADTQGAAGYAGRLQSAWDQTMLQVQQARKSLTAMPRAMFIFSSTGSTMVAGEDTAAHAVMQYAGLENCLVGFRGYRQFTAEAMIAAAPDVILYPQDTPGLDNASTEALWALPGLALTPAGKRRTAFTVDLLGLLGFGPRLPEHVALLNRQAYQAMTQG